MRTQVTSSHAFHCLAVFIYQDVGFGFAAENSHVAFLWFALAILTRCGFYGFLRMCEILPIDKESLGFVMSTVEDVNLEVACITISFPKVWRSFSAEQFTIIFDHSTVCNLKQAITSAR